MLEQVDWLSLTETCFLFHPVPPNMKTPLFHFHHVPLYMKTPLFLFHTMQFVPTYSIWLFYISGGENWLQCFLQSVGERVRDKFWRLLLTPISQFLSPPLPPSSYYFSIYATPKCITHGVSPHFTQWSHLHFGCKCCRNHVGDKVGLPDFTQWRWTQGVGLRPTLRRRCGPPAHRSKDSEIDCGPSAPTEWTVKSMWNTFFQSDNMSIHKR